MTRRARLAEIATVYQGLGMSGRAAGARLGDWGVRAVGVGDIQDDRVDLSRIRTLWIERNARTERYSLQPGDVLVTARSSRFKAALLPPSTESTIADASLNVIRPGRPELGPYLWWFMTSKGGRERMESLMKGATVLALLPSQVAAVGVPLPPDVHIAQIAELVEASEQAYTAAIEAAEIRRSAFRDRIVDALLRDAEGTRERQWF